MEQVVSYFQDMRSKVVLKFEGLWDLNEMKKHPEYAQVDEKVFNEYRKQRDAGTKGEHKE